MYFPDLSPYEYLKGRPAALNVGWLDPAHLFTRGDVPDGFVARLRSLARRPVNQTRGFYVCPFCDFGPATGNTDKAAQHRRWREAEALSSAEIRVVGRDGTAYAAPILICHYVERHGYRPPPEFVQAVMETAPAAVLVSMGAFRTALLRALRASPLVRWWWGRRLRVTPPRRDSFISHPVVSPMESSASPYPYVFVESDGAARELHPGEREYLETPYHPADGARPYVKRDYEARDGWGSFAGFCLRAQLPEGTAVRGAPTENPSKPMSEAELVAYLQRKGFRVERPDVGR